MANENPINVRKSFLNFVLRNYFPQNEEQTKKKKKLGINSLRQALQQNSDDNNLRFKKYLIYQLPTLIMSGKIQYKEEYFSELLQLQSIEDEKGYFQKVYQSCDQQPEHNSMAIIGRWLEKSYGKDPTQQYFGHKYFRDLIEKKGYGEITSDIQRLELPKKLERYRKHTLELLRKKYTKETLGEN